MKEKIVKLNKTKRSFLSEKISKTDKLLARLIKKEETRIRSTKLEMKNKRYNRQYRNTKDYKRLL